MISAGYWAGLILAIASAALGGDASTEMARYVRTAGDKYALECTFRIVKQNAGWTITSRTDRGELRMEVETRYDAEDRLVAARVVTTAQDKMKAVVVKFKDGKASVQRDGQPAVEFDAPRGTIVTSAPDWTDVFLLCRRYDRERKGKQEFPALWIHPTEPPQRLKFTIEPQGSDRIERDGKPLALTRFLIRIRNNSGYLAWADTHGRLVRLLPLPAKDTAAGLTLEGYEKDAAGLRAAP